MEIIGLIVLLLLVFLVALPFIVFSLCGRVSKLEREVKELHKHLRKQSTNQQQADQNAKVVPEETVSQTRPQVTEPQPEVVFPRKLPPALPQPVSKATPEPEASPGFDFPGWLDRFGLKPPGGESPEANPVAWWCTRIGVGLGIIAAVFLGQYVNQFTTPWIRLTQLVALAVGVLGFGCWIEKKKEAFGRALQAGGIGLAFVAAFASYALPAMKIFDEPGISVGLQVLVLLGLVTWSWIRESEPMATLSLILGFLTTGFALEVDLKYFPLPSHFLLGGLGAVFLSFKKWWTSLWASVIGSLLGIMALGAVRWFGNSQAGAFGLFTVLALATIWASVIVWKGEDRKQLAVLASGLALAMGAWITGWSGLAWKHYFLGGVITMGGLGFIAQKIQGSRKLAGAFWAKGIIFLSLYFIAVFSGPIRPFSLLVQGGSLLWLARREKWKIAEGGALAAGLTGLGFFLNEQNLISRMTWNWDELYLGLYLAGGAAMISWWMRWREDLNEIGILFLSLITGFWAFRFDLVIEHQWSLLGSLAGMILLLLARFIRKEPLIWNPASVAFLGGGFGLVISGLPFWPSITWLVLVFPFTWMILREESLPNRNFLQGTISLSVIPILGLLVFDQIGLRAVAPTYFLLSIVWLALAKFEPKFRLQTHSMIAAALATFIILIHSTIETDRSTILFSLLLAAIHWALSRMWNSEHPKSAEWIRGLALGLTSLIAFNEFLPQNLWVIVIPIVSVLWFAAWIKTGEEPLSWVGIIFWIASASHFFDHLQEFHGLAILIGFITALANGLGIIHFGKTGVLANKPTASIGWSTLALVSVIGGLLMMPSSDKWMTAAWAAAAIFLLVIGLLDRLRYFRIVGLLGVGCAIARMFIIDVQEPLWRIVAFGVTSILLVGVGFAYYHFQQKVMEEDRDVPDIAPS